MDGKERRQQLIDMARGLPPRLQQITTPDGRQHVIWRIGRGIIKLPLAEYEGLRELATK